ncbi:MAG: patatin-like phospholipase family protein [Mizugakiibacter sp.]|uniref:patatin-like phospholipase family protein n=1 Tax=Mizugakiibacter sp. TaxID=1972610 RepID=UPI0031BFEA24|nr:patatin-like phospholipase family protein [Xanthomonadaceae bacterium]
MLEILVIAFFVVGVAVERDSWAADCIGLVLGGGGARGAAHIGVLKVLEREHIPICKIAGTSMGAIIGGMYASGYSPEDIERILGEIDWKDVLGDDPPREKLSMRRKNQDLEFLLGYEIGYRNGRITAPQGLIQGQKLLVLLREILASTWKIDNFDDLPIPFRAVAADLVSGQPVVWSQGDLVLAIRSSMSVPGAFAPLTVDDYLLVDGGIYDNDPVDVARAMGANRLIVVDVGTPIMKREDLTTPVAILNQVVSTLSQDRINRELASLGPRDVLISPELGDFSAAAFDKAATVIPIGERAAEKVLDRLQPFKADARTYAEFTARHRLIAFTPPVVRFVKVDSANAGAVRLLEREMRVLVGKPLDATQVDRLIEAAYGSGRYQTIRYRVVDRDGEAGLEITAVDKPWGPNVAEFGFQLSSDFSGNNDYQIKTDVTFQNVNDAGGELRNRLRLGGVSGIESEFYQPFGLGARFFATSQVGYAAENIPRFDGTEQIADYRLRRAGLRVGIGMYLSNNLAVAVGLKYGHDWLGRHIGATDAIADSDAAFGAASAKVEYDTLDDAIFPAHGMRLDFNADYYRDQLGSSANADSYKMVWDGVLSGGENHFLLGTRLASSTNSSVVEVNDALGGFLNLSGYPERGIVAPNVAFGRVVYYRQLGDPQALFTVPVYFGASVEGGHVWGQQQATNLNLDAVVYAGSIFAGVKTPFGPLFLGYGQTSNGHSSVYLTFGTLIRPRF